MIQFLKRYFKKGHSAFLHGKAFKKMECKNYIGADKILEKLCQDDQDDNIEYSYYLLGRCYYALGNYKKALNWFAKSYKLYRQNVSAKSDSTYEKCYRELVALYCYTLKKEGNIELAKQIQSDLKKIS
jgi:tetratricopeptide (TPR) repeat protein